jgi:hypothetical protein
MTAPTAGYSLVLPPGWVQLPLDQEAGPALAGLLDRAFRDVPPDVPPDTAAALRRKLEGQLTRTIASARASGGRELYVPVERMGGVLVPASFVVAEVSPTPDGDGGAHLVDRVLARLVAREDAAGLVDVDGGPALRSESRAARDEIGSTGVQAGARRVEYLLPVPGSPGRWLAVSCSVLEPEDDEDDLAGLLVELFDAVMTTFRWSSR